MKSGSMKSVVLKTAGAIARKLPPGLAVSLLRLGSLPHNMMAKVKPVFHDDPEIEKKQADTHYRKMCPKGYEQNPEEMKYLNARLKAIQKFVKPGNVLEVGCAEGFFTRQFAKSGHTSTGIDFSSHLLKLAKRHKEEEGIANAVFIEARAEKLPFPDSSFETIFLGEILEHVKDVPQVLQESYRVAKPGARFIITLPTSMMRSPDHRRVIMPRQLRKYLAPMADVRELFVISAHHYCCIADLKK